MITLKSCPVCESYLVKEFQIVPSAEIIVQIIPDVKVNAQIITRYCVCQNCNLIFQNPRLSDAELDKYYSTGYYRRTINQPPEGMDAGEVNRAKTDAEIIKRYVGKVTSHLDIGCGRGYLLDAIGASVRVGTESNVGYVSVKGVEVYREMNQVRPKKFDVVTVVHVLEHVPYPLDFLKKVTKFVGKSGHMVIEVPSRETRGGPLGFAHLSYFEPDVLKKICKEVGLCVLHTEFTPHLLLICKLE